MLGMGFQYPPEHVNESLFLLCPANHTWTFLSAIFIGPVPHMGVWIRLAFASVDKIHIPSVYFNLYICKDQSSNWCGCHTEQAIWGKEKRTVKDTSSLLNWKSSVTAPWQIDKVTKSRREMAKTNSADSVNQKLTLRDKY